MQQREDTADSEVIHQLTQLQHIVSQQQDAITSLKEENAKQQSEIVNLQMLCSEKGLSNSEQQYLYNST